MQGHAFTSVYMETTSIRNNLHGVLIPKTNIFGKNKLECYLKLYGPFLWMAFNCLKARATSRRQFTFYY